MNIESQRHQAPEFRPVFSRLRPARELAREADLQLTLGRIVAAERLEALAEAAREAGR